MARPDRSLTQRYREAKARAPKADLKDEVKLEDRASRALGQGLCWKMTP